MVSQEKVLDRLRDEIKLQEIEKHKLIQFKTTKVKRLNQLEDQSREMEIMQSLNLPKMIAHISDQHQQIKNLSAGQAHKQVEVQSIEQISNKKLGLLHDKYQNEAKMKE